MHEDTPKEMGRGIYKKAPEAGFRGETGAGGGNRTRTSSLEGWSSIIELHPLRMGVIYGRIRGLASRKLEKIAELL